mgnify:FL=1
MLFLLLLVNPAYAQEEETKPPSTEDQLEEQIQEIEEQMQVQVENTMAICAALGIVCEEEAATDLVKALNGLVAASPSPPEAPDTESPEEETEEP